MNGTNDVTDKTTEAVVGQGISLSAEGMPEGATYDWNVSGYAVGGYTANVNSGVLQTLGTW